MRYFVLLFCFGIILTPAYSQYSLCGTVLLEGKIQDSVKVVIVNTNDSIFTNKRGEFCFEKLAKGDYFLLSSYFGITSPIVKVSINNKNVNTRIEMLPISLNDINIKGQKDNKSLENHSIKIDVIDLNEKSKSSESIENIMNRSSGIRVRNSGGLGDKTEIVVGGFTGKSVKFLIDGIPIDYLGSSVGLSKISSNMAERIEVYKGVMPTEIGIDALGAVINIVTLKPSTTKHIATYEAGSFNTHRLSFSSYIKLSDKFAFGGNLFSTYAANNFSVDKLPIVDYATGQTRYITAKLFNNSYQQYSGDIFINLMGRKWADLFTFKVNSYYLTRDIQNDFASRALAYGNTFRREFARLVPSIKFEKKLRNDKIQLSQFLVYSKINFQLIDSLKNTYYDWLGNKHTTVSGSETGIDFSKLKKQIIDSDVKNLTYRGVSSFKINENHKIILNVVNMYLIRTSDDLTAYQIKTRIDYNRFIAGLGYQYNIIRKKNQIIEGLTQIKALHSLTHGNIKDNQNKQSIVNSGISYAQSFKYQINTQWLIRASAENTYRLPDQMEIFGDNVFILSNPFLRPEKSLNLNFGTKFSCDKTLNVEISTYYRSVTDLIRLQEITQFQSKFLNLDKVKGYGIEVESFVKIWENLNITGNLTYNDFRLKGFTDNFNSNNTHFMNARVNNMPFYFGNVQLSYRIDSLFTTKDKLGFYWSYTYVHQFYLDFIEKQYEPEGFLGLFGKSKIYTERVIPIQQVHSVGFVWTFDLTNNKKLSVSSELNNLFNTPIYNDFKMQSAGRSIMGKISFEF